MPFLPAKVLLKDVACVRRYFGPVLDPLRISLDPELELLLDFAPGDSEEVNIIPLNREIRDLTTNPLAHL